MIERSTTIGVTQHPPCLSLSHTPSHSLLTFSPPLTTAISSCYPRGLHHLVLARASTVPRSPATLSLPVARTPFAPSICVPRAVHSSSSAPYASRASSTVWVSSTDARLAFLLPLPRSRDRQHRHRARAQAADSLWNRLPTRMQKQGVLLLFATGRRGSHPDSAILPLLKSSCSPALHGPLTTSPTSASGL